MNKETPYEETGLLDEINQDKEVIDDSESILNEIEGYGDDVEEESYDEETTYDTPEDTKPDQTSEEYETEEKLDKNEENTEERDSKEILDEKENDESIEQEEANTAEETGEDVEQLESQETVAQLLEKQKEARNELEKKASDIQAVSEFLDDEGNSIAARSPGSIELKMLDIEEEVRQAGKLRDGDPDVQLLQDSIRQFGLLSPITVVEYGDYYVLVDGYRRLHAYIGLGRTKIPAIVDTTIPPELIRYYQPVYNNVLDTTFLEKLRYGRYVEQNQPNVGTSAIEQSLGLKTGEYLKMLYIDQFKEDFPEIFQQVQNERLTIEQAYKKIDKEIEKQQKEQDALDSADMEEKIKNENELDELQQEVQKQKLGDRKVLDPVIRRSVESRAGGACECCGYGKGEPDLMGAFQVHHMVPVQYGGSDGKSNLILLCHNCHKLVHDYETGRFTPEKETYDRLNDVKKIVVLGNIIMRLRKKALHVIRTNHANIGRQVDKGVLTVGQALIKANVDLKGEETYNNSPYDTYKEVTDNLQFGGEVTGSLGEMEDVEEAEEIEEAAAGNTE